MGERDEGKNGAETKFFILVYKPDLVFAGWDFEGLKRVIGLQNGSGAVIDVGFPWMIIRLRQNHHRGLLDGNFHLDSLVAKLAGEYSSIGFVRHRHE